MKSVAFVSLGCAKNLVDTEVMLAKLGTAGWRLESQASDADAVVINTCAFIDAAKAESTQTILDYAARKRRGQLLVVAGCLAQRYGEQLQVLIPEIDGIVGTGAYASVADVLAEAQDGTHPLRLERAQEPEHDFLPRLVTTAPATAYLKIAEGCDHPCTFCIIPQLRGRFRSRSSESILKEARALAAAGTKELILIAQDTSMWGRDRRLGSAALADLLESLAVVDGIEWIRLLYLYPATVNRELIGAIAAIPQVCKYVDMPLQHAHPEILRAMRRPADGERYLELIEEFRSRVTGVTMRSTFIVGFPGETEEHVAYLHDWIERAELDRVGFFEYSAEEGTPAAGHSGVIPARERRRRLVRLREVQRLASERARSKRIGQCVRVLVEEHRKTPLGDDFRTRLGTATAWYGRSQGEAPGVDGGIYFTGETNAGEFVDVMLDGHGPFDFFGHVA